MPHWAQNNALDAIFRFAVTFGCSPEEVCAGVGLDLDQALAIDALVPHGKIIDAVEWCAERCGETSFGLLLAARTDPRTLGLYILISERSHSIGLYYEMLRQNLPLHTTGYTYAFSTDATGGVGRLLIHSQHRLPARHFAECALALQVHLLRRMIGADWRPRGVQFTHARVGDAANYQTAFGAPVSFEAGRNAILFSAEDLLWRAHRPRHQPFGAIERQLRSVAIDEAHDHVGRASEVIRALLPAVPTLQIVAAELAMSPRSLQRRLRAVGTNFTELLISTRVSLAQEYLRHSGVTIAEVAQRLGFSQVSVLSRMLRRELGASPRILQKAPGSGSRRPSPIRRG